MAEFTSATIHNTINLYLIQTQMHGYTRYMLQLIKTSRSTRGRNIPLIYDVSIDEDRERMYFIIPRLKSPVNTTKAEDNYLSIQINSQHTSDEVISKFYHQYPTFELCSPGFADKHQCKQWWHKHSKKYNPPNTPHWENHEMIIISLWMW